MTSEGPVVLMILDGWGLREDPVGNAVAMARTPVLDQLMRTCPNASLLCSGEDVGLPKGIMGNSEVGHLNIGAGRIVYQDLLRIDRAIADGSLSSNPALVSAMDTVRETGNTLHFMGLVSDGGVHSQLSHLIALVAMASERGVEKIRIHAITDGRDTPPDSGASYIDALEAGIVPFSGAKIATVCGRFYAMDRDTRWERTEAAYRLYAEGRGETAPFAGQAVADSYRNEVYDEFIPPTRISDDGVIGDGDAVVFFNFRADRARQITRAFTESGFSHFERKALPGLAGFVCMTRYDASFDLPVAFPPQRHAGILGEVLARNGKTQLRIAETEKYAHVTYFFNGGEEAPFEGEDRCLIPSPRDVETYDLKPEMSADLVGDTLVERLEAGAPDFVAVNFANMDMVGHTGMLEAAIQAVQTVDRNVGKVVECVRKLGGTLLITADHGNAEQMQDENGGPHTAHTTNPVPVMLVDDSGRWSGLESGRLADIAPTVLAIMGMAQPPEMTGASLLI